MSSRRSLSESTPIVCPTRRPARARSFLGTRAHGPTLSSAAPGPLHRASAGTSGNVGFEAHRCVMVVNPRHQQVFTKVTLEQQPSPGFHCGGRDFRFPGGRDGAGRDRRGAHAWCSRGSSGSGVGMVRGGRVAREQPHEPEAECGDAPDDGHAHRHGMIEFLGTRAQSCSTEGRQNLQSGPIRDSPVPQGSGS